VNDQKSAPPSEFVKHLESKISGFPEHRFLAKHQKSELDKKVESLDLGKVVIKRDFAEKLPIEEFDEAQT
jgi:hypothetical protein